MREPFLVYASSRRFNPRQVEGTSFHFAVSKTFESSKFEHCYRLFQHWWRQGGGEPGKLSLPTDEDFIQLSRKADVKRPSEKDNSLLKRQPEKKPPPNPPQREQPVQMPVAPQQLSVAPQLPSVDPVPPNDDFATPSGGNSIESLDCLRPPRPPFEDDVEIMSLVGKGSFGRVYRARWDASVVAIKIIEHIDQGKPAVMAFEGALSANLAHPNLVQTFKYSVRDMKQAGASGLWGFGGFEVWIVQEWCGLGTLNAKLTTMDTVKKGAFGEVIEVGSEISSAAYYLHMRGIIHGDLTANNVMLVEKDCPKGYATKVTDFGLARVLDNGASGIMTTTMGTVTYMPPELFSLSGCSLTKKVDVYAFGVILWQLCTGQQPFDGLQPTQVVVMVAQGATLEMPDAVPHAISETFNLCVTRKPSLRPGFDRILPDLLKLAKLKGILPGLPTAATDK